MLITLTLFAIFTSQNASPRLLPNPHSLRQPQSITQGAKDYASKEQEPSDYRPGFVLVAGAQGQNETDGDKGASPNKPDKAWSTSDKIAVGACVAGFLQFLALIATIWTMHRFSRRQLRAYVLPSDMHMTDGTNLTPPEPHKKDIPGVALIIRNSGQTPAYNVISWAQIDVIPTQNERQLNIPPMEGISRHTLGVGGTSNKGLWYDRTLNAAEIDEIGRGMRGIYVHGRIEYSDAFGKQHFTNFRLVFTGKIFPPSGSGNFTFCNNGNDSN